jgi:hypothetical protein
VSLSAVVDERYRLTPADLNGRARQVMIKAVTFEGVEQFTPLLHFEGVARPLALDPEQRIDMAAVAHSTLTADWVGVALVLYPLRGDEGETIALLPLDAAGRRSAPEPGWTPRRDAEPGRPGGSRSLRPLLILLALLALAFAAAYLVENMPSLSNLLGLAIIILDVDLWENATTST